MISIKLGAVLVCAQSVMAASSIDVTNATAFALQYAYPLIPFLNLARPYLESVGANAFYNEKALASPDETVVVRPNVDTIYSGLAVDLSSHNLELTIPNITDRFYVYPFYDLYGNNNTDIASVHAIQEEFTIDLVNRSTTSIFDGAPSLSQVLNTTLSSAAVELHPGALNDTVATELLKLLAVVNPYASPESIAAEITLTSNLTEAGIANGTYTQPNGVNFTAAGYLVNTSIAAAIDSPANTVNYGNGWFGEAKAVSGNFHDAYAERAEVAYAGYLELTADIALYPQFVVATLGKNWTYMEVSVNSSILVTFSGKPPVKGFWSLTAYGIDNYLIPNSLGVYAVGDRSNLTYSDGTSVYSDNTDRDDPFQILIQAADIYPSSNWTSNWLPGPSGGGQFEVNLRYYGPEDAITKLSYVEPVVTIIAVVTNSSSSM